MRVSLFLFLFSLSTVCYGSNSKEQLFRQTLNAVVEAISQQDSLAVNRLIHPHQGLSLLYRNGVFDNIEQVDRISFSGEGFPWIMLTHAKGIKKQTLKYGRLPVYSCDKESWSKKGCWTDTTKKSHLVSSICKTRNKLVPDHIPAKKINAYYTLENKSRRIVLVSDDELELIFFLSFIDGKWYLTVIDTVSSDCSA